jgi:hypothetical protein
MPENRVQSLVKDQCLALSCWFIFICFVKAPNNEQGNPTICKVLVFDSLGKKTLVWGGLSLCPSFPLKDRGSAAPGWLAIYQPHRTIQN